MTFTEIPQFIHGGSWECNYSLGSLESTIQDWIKNEKLDLDPDFQRGHVWTPQQQSAFVEYFLQGGRSGLVIYFNKPSWERTPKTDYDDFVIVDGLQRLTALRKFLAGEVPAFGQLYHEFGQDIRMARQANSLKVNVNSLQTKAEVLTWYLQMNAGGTPHSTSEIDRVRGLLASEQK